MIVSLGGASLSEKSAVLTVHTEDYTGVRLDTVTADCTLSAGFGETEIQLPLHRLGYYKATVTAECAGETVQNSTGIGVTTPHDRPDWQDSVFGVSANEWFRFPQSLSALAKMGVRYIRPTGRRVDEPYRALLRKYGLMTTVQAQGRHIMANDRYAPGKWNSAWHYLREMADVIAITEHGNEHWEERNLTLMAEWVKVSGLARWQANPETWFTNSGAAGVDIHKLQVLYDQGMFDYITAVSLHAYTFPMAPEQEKGFWSSRILKDFAKWMDERGIDMPVCCMEQGYPAMNGQTRCESYSPGDLVSLDG
ncbi:MAG: hypothetical protein LBQ48_08275, partial [Oscillospiraceae bacterium]|nr:hypothetical protein [Oscillospiraceae bacterium]